MSGQFLDIILFAVVAIFLIMRLKNILGSEKGKIISIKTAKTGTLKPRSKTNIAETNPRYCILKPIEAEHFFRRSKSGVFNDC